MNSNELRIGNLVYIPKTDQIAEISLIAQEFEKNAFIGVNKDVIGIGGLLLKDIEPIPLTEEWLLKFGFYKFRKNKFRIKITTFAILEIDIEREDKLKCFIVKSDFFRDERIVFRIIKYVHQLQNLYFALIGEELEIKNNL